MAQRGLSKILVCCWQLGCLFFIIIFLYSYLVLYCIICCNFRLVFTSQLVQVLKHWLGRLAQISIKDVKTEKLTSPDWDGFNLWGPQEWESKLEAEDVTFCLKTNNEIWKAGWAASSTTDKLHGARCPLEIPWTVSGARLSDSCMNELISKMCTISTCIFPFLNKQSL